MTGKFLQNSPLYYGYFFYTIGCGAVASYWRTLAIEILI